MSDINIVYAIRNNFNQKYIGKDKLMLWNQTEHLTQAYLGHSAAAARTNCKRLNNYVKTFREQNADPFYRGYKDKSHLDDDFVVVPVELTLA